MLQGPAASGVVLSLGWAMPLLSRFWDPRFALKAVTAQVPSLYSCQLTEPVGVPLLPATVALACTLLPEGTVVTGVCEALWISVTTVATDWVTVKAWQLVVVR